MLQREHRLLSTCYHHHRVIKSEAHSVVRSVRMFRPESSGVFLLCGISLFWKHAHQREHMDGLSYNKGVILIRAVRWLTSGKTTATYIPWGSHSRKSYDAVILPYMCYGTFLPACQESSSWPIFCYFCALANITPNCSPATLSLPPGLQLLYMKSAATPRRLLRASESSAPNNWQFSYKQTDPCLIPPSTVTSYVTWTWPLETSISLPTEDDYLEVRAVCEDWMREMYRATYSVVYMALNKYQFMCCISSKVYTRMLHAT